MSYLILKHLLLNVMGYDKYFLEMSSRKRELRKPILISKGFHASKRIVLALSKDEPSLRQR